MGNITDCYNSGKIIVEEDCAGGIAGINNASIANCYNTGEIDSTKANDIKIGGLCGENTSESFVYTSYNVGKINTKKTANGIIGANFGTVTNTFYLDTCLEKTPEQDEFKKSDTDMKSSIITNIGESFTEDSNNINSGYPILLWQVNNEQNNEQNIEQ